MATHQKVPSGDSVADEAMRWAVAADELSPDRREKLEDWLRSSDLHRAAFKKACRTWRSFACLSELRNEPALKRDARAVIARAKQRRLRRTATLMAASIVVVAIVVAIQWKVPTDQPATYATDIHRANYATQIGELLTVGFPDNSVVLLNADTTLTVRYTDKGRTVELESGEARFEVAHDPARPFAVVAGKGIVKAVGTAFNVQLVADEGVLVTVTEGIVDILPVSPTIEGDVESDAPSVQRLTEGHNAKITDIVEEISVTDPEVLERKLASHQGWLRFVNAPLGEVIAQADRYTGKTLLLADAELASRPVTISAKANDIDGLLTVLDESSGAIEVTSLPTNEVIISASSSP